MSETRLQSGSSSYCDICDSALRSHNTAGVCTTNPECRRENQRRHRAIQTMKTCSNCNREFFDDGGSAHGWCHTCYHKWLQAGKPEVIPVYLTCEICGSRISHNNIIGICTQNPQCREARQPKLVAYSKVCSGCNKQVQTLKGYGFCETCYRRWTNAGKPRNSADMPEVPKIRTCEICGGPINDSNRIGICQETAACRRAYDRKVYAEDPEKFRLRKSEERRLARYDFIYALFSATARILKIGKGSLHAHKWTAQKRMRDWGLVFEDVSEIWRDSGLFQEETYMQAMVSFELKPLSIKQTRMPEWFETGDYSAEDLKLMLKDLYNKMPTPKWLLP